MSLIDLYYGILHYAGGQVGHDTGVYRTIIENSDLDTLASLSAEFVKRNLR